MTQKLKQEKCTMCAKPADLTLHGKPVCNKCYDLLEQLKDKLNQNHTRWF